MKTIILFVFLTLSLAANPTEEKAEEAVFELRTYEVHEGKMDDLLKRFREHTTTLFEKHGMINIGYWLSEEKEEEAPKLIYIVRHESAAKAKESWSAFKKDPVWRAAHKASIEDGKIVSKIQSQFLTATDFSTIK